MGDFVMPSLGADMEKGTIVEWRVVPGDTVTRGDIVAVVNTDKADIEIETFESGTIGELLAAVGDEVPVGQVIARIVTAEKSPAARARPSAPEPVVAPGPVVAAAPAPAERPPAPAAAPAPAARAPEPVAARPRRVRAEPAGARVSPRARRMAEALHVDLAALVDAAGERPVTGDDVERAARTAPSPAGGPVPPPPGRPAAAAGRQPARAAGPDPVGRLMERSKREIPHFYVSEDVDVTAALAWLERRNDPLPPNERVLPAALFLRAVVVALRDVPELNGHVIDGQPCPSARVDLAFAVSQRGGGLVSPVISGAQDLCLTDLMTAMRERVARVRSGGLRSSDVADATITVTNLGEQGACSVLGVIVPPQAALVGIGRVLERPWAVDGMLAVRKVVTVTLSADHRASHGHRGSRFLRSVARALENPEVLA